MGSRRAFKRYWLLLALLGTVVHWSCESDDAIEFPGDGGAGGQTDAPSSSSASATSDVASSSSTSASGVSSSTAAGGGAGDCLTPTDCPGSDAACLYRVCSAGSCGFETGAAGKACEGGGTCDGLGNCLGKELGGPCTLAVECLSAICVDDVCCSSACGGVCEACSVSKTGSVNGTCAPVLQGSDPDGECPGSSVCDGNGACM